MPLKSEEKAYEKIIETSRNNEYTTGNLLDFVYFRKKYKLIATELNKQTKLKDKISYCNRSVLLVKF